jgi:replication factor A1
VANSTIDVIGVVVHTGQVGTLKLKTGETRDKRNLVIGDDTNFSISVTLWGETAAKLDLKPGMMIACKQCKISEYNGKSLNGSSSLSDYVIGSVNHVRATAI